MPHYKISLRIKMNSNRFKQLNYGYKSIVVAALLGCTGMAEPMANGNAQCISARVVDVESLKPEERLAVLAIQGIANRNEARIFIQTGQALRWNQIEYDRDNKEKGGLVWSPTDATNLREKYSNTCDYWMDYITKSGMATFTPATLENLFTEFSPEIRGAILYDNLVEDYSAVATLAGVESAVPMTREIHRKLSSELGREIPIILDFNDIRRSYPAGVDKRIEAHRWLLKNVLPRCDHSGALSRDKTYGENAHDTLIDTDLAVKNRWVAFDLSYMSEETRTGGTHDKPNPVWGFDPPDKPLLIEILGSLKPYSPVYGWGRPYESALIRRLAKSGGVKICTGNGNGSFFDVLPMQTKSFSQIIPHVMDVKLEKKIYVAFAVNEGDTLKYLTSLVNGGNWLQSQRGTLPINWGMDPLLYEKFPGLVSYYYKTATANDYFFTAPSGWGYLAPMMLPDAQIATYGELVKRGGLLADTRYIDVWWMSGLRKRNQFFPLLSAMGVRGLTQWTDRQEVEFAPDGTPIIHSNLYYVRNRPEVMAAKLRTIAQTMGKPWFIFVYGGSPYWFSEVAKHLPESDFKIVKMDEFFESARSARPLIEKRVYKVKKEDITEAP